MKPLRRTMLFLIITFLLTTPSVFAQDKDPPVIIPEPSQDEPLLIKAPLSDTDIPYNIQNQIKRSDSAKLNSPRSVTNTTDAFCIECDVGENENRSEVAYGGGYYVVAFEDDDTISANVFSEDGSLHLTVDDISSAASDPDVAYLSSWGLFMIVWKYDFYGNGTDYDIRSVALSPASGLVGSAETVTASSKDEESPSIDCNPNNDSCLIAYKYDDGSTTHIYGRFMDVDVSGVSNSSPPSFPVSTTTSGSVTLPHVAHGNFAYIVAYTWHDNSSTKWPVYSHVYPNYQSVGNQYMHETTYLVGPGTLNDSNNKESSAVAWDGCSQTFAVSFTYDFNGDGSDFDIGIVGVPPLTAGTYNLQWVANTTHQELNADISFIDPSFTGNPPYASKLVTTYLRADSTWEESEIITTDLASNCYSLNPSYTIDPESQHFIIDWGDLDFDTAVTRPAITGADGFRSYLVTWTGLDISGGAEYDVFGMLMDASEKNFLPLNNK